MVRIACTWKCMSYFPTSWAILQTRCEKCTCIWGAQCSSGISRSCGGLLSPAGTSVASSMGQPSETPLWGSCLPQLLRVFFLAWLPPCWAWWSHLCSHLSQLPGRWWLWGHPHLLQSLHLLPPLFLTWGWGLCNFIFLCSWMDLCPCFDLTFLPCSGGHLYPSHAGIENQPIRNWGSFAEVTWYLWTCCYIFFQKFCSRSFYFSLLFLPCPMSGENLHGS